MASSDVYTVIVMWRWYIVMWRWYTVIVCGGDTLSLFVVVIHCHCGDDTLSLLCGGGTLSLFVVVIHCHCLWWWYTLIVCGDDTLSLLCGGDTLSLLVVVIHCHCLWRCRTDCVETETVITVWRCMTSCDINILSLLCFSSVETCYQPWHKCTIIVMFQVCGDMLSAMTQMHYHCYVSGLWRHVISHDTNALSLLCFSSVEMCVQPWHKYTVIVTFRSVEMCDHRYTVLVLFQVCGDGCPS